MSRLSLAVVGALVAVALTGCASTPPTSAPVESTKPPVAESPSPGASQAPAAPSLATADSTFGTIVVDTKGMTVYVYDGDTAGSGVSTCSGKCLVDWPSVHPVGAGDPVGDGITGELGVITGTDGKPQLTLNGLPLYYLINDKKAGDVKGQGAANIWWVVAPDGTKITG